MWRSRATERDRERELLSDVKKSKMLKVLKATKQT